MMFATNRSWTTKESIMKHEQKFHLNRLAAMLVTPERFDEDPITPATRRKWAELHAAAADLAERKVTIANGVQKILPTAEAAESLRQAIREHLALTNGQGRCPEGDPRCMAYYVPPGHGFHARCQMPTEPSSITIYGENNRRVGL